jgi:hypothetical protein
MAPTAVVLARILSPVTPEITDARGLAKYCAHPRLDHRRAQWHHPQRNFRSKPMRATAIVLIRRPIAAKG